MIDVRTRKIVAGLKDEAGRDVQSEKLLEVDFRGAEPVRAGDQFGFGRPGARPPSRRNPDGRSRSRRGGRRVPASASARARRCVAAGRLISRASASSSALPRRSRRMMVPSGSMR